MIWKIWKKNKLNSEKTWQLQYGRKASRIVKKIWKIRKKVG